MTKNKTDVDRGEPPAPRDRFARCNAELQYRTDAVGTWLLIADGDVAIPLTCYGPDRHIERDRVLALIDRGA